MRQGLQLSGKVSLGEWSHSSKKLKKKVDTALLGFATISFFHQVAFHFPPHMHIYVADFPFP